MCRKQKRKINDFFSGIADIRNSLMQNFRGDEQHDKIYEVKLG
jgi:hypothetical protein